MGVFWGDALTSFRMQETSGRDVRLYSCLSQNIFCCRLLAFDLLSFNGEIDLRKCLDSIRFLEENISYPWTGSEQWIRMNSQIGRVLRWLLVPDILQIFYSIGPSCKDPKIARVVLETCFDTNNFSENIPSPSLYQIRFAVLVSWMSYFGPGLSRGQFSVPLLRFHEKCPKLFLFDLKNLIENGFVRRMVDGQAMIQEFNIDNISAILRRKIKYSHEMSYLTPLVVALSMSGVFREHDPIAIRDCFEKHVFDWAHDRRWSFNEIIRKVLVKIYGLSDEIVNSLPSWPKGLVPKDSSIVFPSERLFWEARLVLDHEKLSQSLFRRLCQSDLLFVWRDTIISLVTKQKDLCHRYLETGLGICNPDGVFSGFDLWTKERLERLSEEEKTLTNKARLLEEHCQEIYSRSTRVNDRAAQWMKAELASLSWEKDGYIKHREDVLLRMNRLESFCKLLPNMFLKMLTKFFFLESLDLDDDQLEFSDSSKLHIKFCLKGYLRSSPQLITGWDLFCEVLKECLQFCKQEIVSIESNRLGQVEDLDLNNLIFNLFKGGSIISGCETRFASFLFDGGSVCPLKGPWEISSSTSFERCCQVIFQGRGLEKKHVVSLCEEVDDFWVFLMDSVERCGTFFFEQCSNNEEESLLLSSNRSIFLFRPGVRRFFKGLVSDLYPYTWIRDSFLNPSREAYFVKLDQDLQSKLIEDFLSQKKLLKEITSGTFHENEEEEPKIDP
uniref:hypothetical protein n=1 Tax=Candidatus Similichlamydia epinepheli TaxID=1903953 RepID=UPI001300545C